MSSPPPAKDPVAAHSSFLCTYMGGHPSTLVAYATYFGGVQEKLEGAKMTSINSREMTLSYKPTYGKEASVTIPFNPPLLGYEEVKPRLIQMKTEAEEGIGMIKTPTISSYSVPTLALLSVVFFGTLTVFTLAPYEEATPLVWYDDAPKNFAYVVPIVNEAATLFTYLRRLVHYSPPVATIIWGSLAAMQIAETAYMAYLCKKHKTGLSLGLAWTLSTLLFGIPFLSEFRRKLNHARIQSISKTR